jgi:hypothetical protein
VHDYFDIIGIPGGASAREIRRACARRTGAGHPDFRVGRLAAGPPASTTATVVLPEATDVAIDFVDMTPIVARMQAAFFASR